MYLINYLRRHSLETESVTPRDELARFLASRKSVMGEVFRLTALRMKPREMAAQRNLDNCEFVYFYWDVINACLDGAASHKANWIHSRVIGMIPGLQKERENLSPLAQRRLATNLRKIEKMQARESEARKSARDPSNILSIIKSVYGVTGVYVISYPCQLDAGLMKVGWGRDVGTRLRQHLGGPPTLKPEPLDILRVYAGGESKAIERAFHARLNEAGHHNTRRGTDLNNPTGTEWFITDLSFLDEIANSLGLITEFAFDPREETSHAPLDGSLG